MKYKFKSLFNEFLNLCLDGGIGIHAGLRSQCRKAWGFESLSRHQYNILEKEYYFQIKYVIVLQCDYGLTDKARAF